MMSANDLVRSARPEDAGACVAIYRPYVEDTAITFETEVPTDNEMAARIASARTSHEWLVLEHNDDVIG
ncbi:MAG: GNAT family N-acetyltransferase, partial [Mycobacterium sp.]